MKISTQLQDNGPLNQQHALLPSHQKFIHFLLVACIIIAPLLVSGWFTLCPQYGNPACPEVSGGLSHVLDSYQAAKPVFLNLFLFLNLLIPYIYPLSYVGIGLVAMKRSFWIAFLGIFCGWLGSIPWSAFADQTSFLHAMAYLRQYDTSFTALATKTMSSWLILAMATGWVLGHLLGYVLLGIALLRGKAVQGWAAWLLIASAIIIGPFAYGTQLGWLQDAGYICIAIGSIPIAAVLLREHNNTSSGLVRDE